MTEKPWHHGPRENDSRDARARSAAAGTDVVIAGGGLIGIGIAWRCVQRGLSATVVDEHFGAGASYAAAGMLAPVTEASYGEEHLLRLCQESLHRYPTFVAELEAMTGADVALRTTGTLQVGFDADDMRALEELHSYHDELGLPAHRLTASEARRLEPSLSPRVRGAVHVPSDYSVDARALHAALMIAAVTTGVELVPGQISALAVENGRAVGLTLADGSVVPGDCVVLALGTGTASLPGAPALPVRPVGGQILRLKSDDHVLDRTVRALVRGRGVYLVPLRQTGIIVGATVEEKGYDSRVTAGGVHELLRDAIDVVPGLSEAELTETMVRFRPGTPDNAPIIGPADVPGLILATGHYRNGVLLTPLTADAIADLVADGAVPEVAEGFGPDRFVAQTGAHP
jgi:glycine oxidase